VKARVAAEIVVLQRPRAWELVEESVSCAFVHWSEAFVQANLPRKSSKKGTKVTMKTIATARPIKSA
jgi:hypothetical protein